MGTELLSAEGIWRIFNDCLFGVASAFLLYRRVSHNSAS